MSADATEWIGAMLAGARPQAMAALLRYFRNLDEAEEAFQEACLRALSAWPKNGPPREILSPQPLVRERQVEPAMQPPRSPKSISAHLGGCDPFCRKASKIAKRQFAHGEINGGTQSWERSVERFKLLRDLNSTGNSVIVNLIAKPLGNFSD